MFQGLLAKGHVPIVGICLTYYLLQHVHTHLKADLHSQKRVCSLLTLCHSTFEKSPATVALSLVHVLGPAASWNTMLHPPGDYRTGDTERLEGGSSAHLWRLAA